MGRKIPGRKHHGVRDPEKQAAERFNKIKDKINAPPTNPDHQEVSKSLQRLIELKNKTRSGEFSNRRKNKNKRKEQPHTAPVFQQRLGESNTRFIRRVNMVCMNVTREADFEQKYGVEIKRNEDGEVESVVKRPKDAVELMMKQIKKEKKEKKVKKKKKNVDTENAEPRLTKSQKWQRKKKEKLMKKKSHKSEDKEDYRDNVKFGEIVHAPPTLVAPRKVNKLQQAPRPGKKNLLLKDLLPTNHSLTTTKDKQDKKQDSTLRKVTNKAINKKGKRKDLPNALRRQLDTQQKEIINAYKELKSKRYNKS